MNISTRFSFFAGVAALSLIGAKAQTPPNIILFLVDDMGWQETSVPFWSDSTLLNRRYHTPNMERLARQGVKFTEAYACAISSPSRCSLMTGMNAARHRVTNWTIRKDTPTDAYSPELLPPDWNYNGIQPDGTRLPHATAATPLPELLRRAGYYTIHCGKAHFGAVGTPSEDPCNMGFDVNIAGGANGAPGSYLAQENYGGGLYHVKGLEQYKQQGIFLTEALTREALRQLEVPIREHRPFYLYMSHYAIHAPYSPDERFTAHYRDASGKGRYDAQLKAPLNEMEINHAALIEGMDKSLGDLLHFLDKHPDVARNTVIIFMSDNGGQGVSVRQGRENFDQNYPLRAGKGSAYLGGVREPMLVYWPGVTPAGKVSRQRLLIEDFYPTILEMAHADVRQATQHVDGRSFLSALRHPERSHRRPLIWHYPNLWGESQDRQEGYHAYSSVLKGDYHLIYYWATQSFDLFNVRKDIGERHNLAASQPRRVRRMARYLTKALQKADAQRPLNRSTKQPFPWPDEVAAKLK